MEISLASVLPLFDPRSYKVHLASYNQRDQPLDVFVRDRAGWDKWNSWRPSVDDFNRSFIFALIDFYPEPETWLFGGVYRVISRTEVIRDHGYNVEHVPEFGAFVGRLKVHFRRPSRNRALRLERYLDEMWVSEILKEPYVGDRFPGYENICHDFPALETIFKNCRPDWKAALEHVKGVYLIADKSNGKKYVGSAYGDQGLWARWSCYLGTGHGGTDELTKLIGAEGIEYARRNFRISLLEYRSARTDDQVIIDREVYWKEALLARTPLGYCKN